MIEQRNSLSLSRQCQLLGLSRAALYYRPLEVSAYELELMALIDRQYLRTPFYGSQTDDRLATDEGRPGQSQTGAASDGIDGTRGDLPHQPAGTRTSHLSPVCCAR